MTEKKNETTFSITPGRLLVAARDARSLSQTDIAKQLRLSVQAINALEDDDYAYFGVRTFVRGYLSGYARVVNIPEKQVLDAMDSLGLMSTDTHSLLPRIEGAPVLNVTHQPFSAFNRRWLIGATVGVVVIAAAIIWFNTSKQSDDKTKTAATVLKTVDTMALSQPTMSVTNLTPAVAVSQPVIVSKPFVDNHKIKKDDKAKKVAKHHEKASNGFVIRPNMAMHTTYTIKPTTKN